MGDVKQVLAAVALAAGVGAAGTAYGCGAPPSDARGGDRPSVTHGVTPEGKMYLTQGGWSISRDENNNFSISSMFKCASSSAVADKADREMRALAKTACDPKSTVRSELDAGSAEPTQEQFEKFCGSLGSAQIVYPKP